MPSLFGRTCEGCGTKMSPYIPRKRSPKSDRLLCPGCLRREANDVSDVMTRAPEQPRYSAHNGLSCDDCGRHASVSGGLRVEGRKWVCQEGCKTGRTFDRNPYMPRSCNFCANRATIHVDQYDVCIEHVPQALDATSSRRKIAHDSGDGQTIFHCPFCGSGQVTGRSDGTAECDYCGTSFTVQVQPQFPAMPQTIDGEPLEIPGMPGEVGAPEAPQGGDKKKDTPKSDKDKKKDKKKDTPKSDKDKKKDKKKTAALYVTFGGVAMPEGSYMRHLALTHADDREAVLVAMRESGEE